MSAFSNRQSIKDMNDQINDASSGDTILASIDAEIASLSSSNDGKGQAFVDKALEDSEDNVKAMKRRALGARNTLTKTIKPDPVFDSNASLARDWLTASKADEEAESEGIIQALSDKIAAQSAALITAESSMDENFLRTGRLDNVSTLTQDPDSIRTDAERIEDSQFLSGSGVGIEDRIFAPEPTETNGLMSRPYDADRMMDINELPGEAKYPTVTKYLESNDITPADDTVDLATDLAVTNNQFTDRTQALETIQDTYSYADATTSQAFAATIAAESSTSLIERTNYSRSGAVANLGGNNTTRIAAINALFDRANSGSRLDAAQQEELFNIAYGGRMGNANNEGYKYRGRGLIQITGKAEYLRIGKKLGIGDTLVKNPDLLLSNPSIMLAATKAYLDNKGFGTGEMTANTLKDAIGHSGGAAEAEDRWDTVIAALEAAGETEAAARGRLTNEFTAQRLAGTTVDGDIGPNSIAAMTAYLSQPPRNIPVPAGATPQDIVILVNETAL